MQDSQANGLDRKAGKVITRLDLLASTLSLSFALLGAKGIARSKSEELDGSRSGMLPNVEAGFVNASAYGLRAGAGHGEHNAIVVQRCLDDLALIGGTMLIPPGYYEIGSPVSRTVTTP
jgi:hypothetical protein